MRVRLEPLRRRRDPGLGVPIVLCVLGLATGCGGDDDDGPVATPDAGMRVDAGGGPDRDSDEWPDAVDNCPDASNPEQRDRDRDGVGDLCDSCPATPNGGRLGEAGEIAQDGCDLLTEAEPNDTPQTAQSLSLVPIGQIVAVRGAVERRAGGGQAYDRYRLMVPAQTLAHIRVARASPRSLLEPAFQVTQGAYTATRSADGLFVAERQVYFSAAGTYELAVSDRRGTFGDEPKGSDDYLYELSVATVDYTVERIAAPSPAQPITDRPIHRARGHVGLFETDVTTADRLRVVIHSEFNIGLDGVDPILVVESADGTVQGENDEFTPGTFDARLLLEVPSNETWRIVVDHQRIVGDGDVEVALSVDYPPGNQELEPNESLDLASDLVFCNQCETIGAIDGDENAAPDIDWYRFEADAGRIISFRGLVDPNSQADPMMAMGRIVDDQFTASYVNADSGGRGSRIDAVIHETGEYYLGLIDQRNLEREMPPFVGGPLFTYTIFTEWVPLLQSTEITQTSTSIGTLNPGGKLGMYRVTLGGPTLVTLRITAMHAELDPRMRLYAPGQTSLLAAHDERILTALPGPATYLLGVSNGNRGIGGPDVQFRLETTLESYTETPEVEPNDGAGEATVARPRPTLLIGEVAGSSDLDRYTFTASAGAQLDAITIEGQVDPAMALYEGMTPVTTATGAIDGFVLPSSGAYELHVSSPLPTDYVIVLKDR